MLLYPISALTTPFRALTTPFSVNTFPNIKAPKAPINILRNPPPCLFISFFTVSLTQSIYTIEFCSDFMILII